MAHRLKIDLICQLCFSEDTLLCCKVWKILIFVGNRDCKKISAQTEVPCCGEPVSQGCLPPLPQYFLPSVVCPLGFWLAPKVPVLTALEEAWRCK